FSTTRTNICIASNLSTPTSVFLYGMNSMQGITIPRLIVKRKETRKEVPLLRHAFHVGIEGIPQTANLLRMMRHQNSSEPISEVVKSFTETRGNHMPNLIDK